MAAQERDGEDRQLYRVVVNDEEQYSIWADYEAENPPGWRDAGKVGTKQECLAYIEEVWTDMRPLSLRRQMEELAQRPPEPEPEEWLRILNGESVVERLCRGEHPFELCLRPEPSVKRLKESVDQGYLRVKFTDTNPGTELGVHLDPDACDFAGADFEGGAGRARAVGHLKLDEVEVRCVVEIDLATLGGRGRLEKIEAGGGPA
jgi:uncharacterized protein YbdZ (MbtH family)